jgi:hypothetical protein
VQLLVVAKAPVPGRVKTRLCPPCTPAVAAGLAGAALADTLAAGTAVPAPVSSRTLVVSGRFRPPAGWGAAGQRGDSFAERLAGAFQDTGQPGVASLLIGMDTPQLTPARLRDAAARLVTPGVDAVLGPAEDGGWWALGLRDPRHAVVLTGVPMSTPGTGRATLRALATRGLRVVLLPVLRDVDTAADALVVAGQCPPGSRFARAVARHLPAAGLPLGAGLPLAAPAAGRRAA